MQILTGTARHGAEGMLWKVPTEPGDKLGTGVGGNEEVGIRESSAIISRWRSISIIFLLNSSDLYQLNAALATNSFLLPATWIADTMAGAQASMMDDEVEVLLRMTKKQVKSLDPDDYHPLYVVYLQTLFM